MPSSARRDIRVTRLKYVERGVFVGSAGMTHVLPVLSGARLQWKTSYTRSERNEPDRREYVYELFTPEFATSVGPPATGTRQCAAGDAVCAKWAARYSADRPHFTGAGQSVPMLMLYGGKDDTIPKDRMRCALDRLTTDGTNLTFCYEPEATHGSIIGVRGEYVADWLGSVTLGTPAPAAWPADQAALTTECNTLLPND